MIAKSLILVKQIEVFGGVFQAELYYPSYGGKQKMKFTKFLCEIGFFHTFDTINGEARCIYCNKTPSVWDFFWGG